MTDREPVLTLEWPMIAGGGFVTSLLFLTLVERLRRTFATRAKLDGLGRRLMDLQSLYLQGNRTDSGAQVEGGNRLTALGGTRSSTTWTGP